MKAIKEFITISDNVIRFQIEKFINKEIVMEYELVKLIPSGDEFILQWEKRIFPLTEDEYKTRYL